MRCPQIQFYLCLCKNGSVASGGAHSIGHPGADELRFEQFVVVQLADDARRSELVREMVFDRVEETERRIRRQYPESGRERRVNYERAEG